MDSSERQHLATFVASTGRCGTQWLWWNLRTHYGDLAVVEHEPLKEGYQPRRLFRAYHSGTPTTLPTEVDRHLTFVTGALRSSHYIETGWPSYGALPFIMERLGPRVRVVHLFRHPLKVAASLTTHGVYDRGEWSEAMSLSPADSGVGQAHLAGEAWASMSGFEKCLFWWTEINRHILQLRERFPDVPWLSVRFEDLFSEQSGRGEARAMAEFMGLPVRSAFVDARDDRRDSYRYRTAERIAPGIARNYPETLAVMAQLDYDLDGCSGRALAARYRKPAHRRLIDAAKRPIRVLMEKTSRVLQHLR